MSKCCAFWAQVIAEWGLPLAVLLLTWAIFQKAATFFLMTRHTSIHEIYMVSIHCWVLEKCSQQFSISIFTRNSPAQVHWVERLHLSKMPLAAAITISGEFKGGKDLHPPLAASNVFCIHICTSPSNDFTAVVCSNNNQAQLRTHSHISLLLISRRLSRARVASRYSGLRTISNKSLASYYNNYMCHEWIYVTGSGWGNPKISGRASCANGWTPLSKFLNPPLTILAKTASLSFVRYTCNFLSRSSLSKTLLPCFWVGKASSSCPLFVLFCMCSTYDFSIDLRWFYLWISIVSKKISCCCSTVLAGVLSNLNTKSAWHCILCKNHSCTKPWSSSFQICLSTSVGEGQSWRAIHKSLEDHERVSYTAAEPSSVRKCKWGVNNSSY